MKAQRRYLQVHTLNGIKDPPFRRLYCRFKYKVGEHEFEFALTQGWDGCTHPYCVTHVISGKQLGPALDMHRPRNDAATKLAATLFVAEQVELRGMERFISRMLEAEANEALEPIPPPEGIRL